MNRVNTFCLQDGFSKFHLYVCAAFLFRWKVELEQKKDFQSILLFIQNVPTAKWSDKVDIWE